MAWFARRTGLSDAGRAPRRYLWTDAFAVCNFLGLEAAGDRASAGMAFRLVEQVHHTLGRYRPDDTRTGWLSGLDDQAARLHPTGGGLRIGKPLPERPAGEPFDPDLEWERDGQYYHYLTRWMHALDQVSRVHEDPEPNRWARELAARAHRAFVYQPPGGGLRRMYWKMSVDLSRPLVASMGQHDPLDGWITCLQLEAHRGNEPAGPSLGREIAELREISGGTRWWTDDPLGLGGLLEDAQKLVRLDAPGLDAEALAGELLEAALAGLKAWLAQRPLDRPADTRLAFRELGLAIGLRAAAGFDVMGPWLELARRIESFWLDPAHQAAESWREHEDINSVMLATSLAPGGYTAIR